MQVQGADVVAEGQRLLDLANAAGVPLRLLGGAAIALRTPDLRPELARAYGDLDFVAAPGGTAGVSRLFADAGYTPDAHFNTIHGKRRLIFVEPERRRKADVFVGSFEMCHKIPVAERLELEPATIPLAELLVTKLQIVELNDKDVRDALGLRAGHEVAEGDGDTVGAARVATLCAADWGLWRTITANLAALRGHAAAYGLPDETVDAIVQRIDALLERIEAEPKSRAWRIRSRVGERVRWYELPEDV
jgi:hypothetical protein